jgi:hypothetical protein
LEKTVRKRKVASRKHRPGKHRPGKMPKAILEETRRVLWMLRVPTSFDQVKGLVSEEKTLRAFTYFQRRKVEFGKMGVITKIIPTIHYSKEDVESIDFEVEFQSGETLFVEVKNRWNFQLERKLLIRNRCLIAIPWKTADEEARKIVLVAVNRFFQKQERRREKQGGSEGQLVGAHH